MMITSSLTSLQQPAGVDAVPEPGEAAQDLRPQAHRLDHLDRRSAALPEAAALIRMTRSSLHGLELC